MTIIQSYYYSAVTKSMKLIATYKLNSNWILSIISIKLRLLQFSL